MYTQSITRTHPTAFVILADYSGSMVQPVHFRGRRMPKAEVVATVINELLFELIERARRTDGIRHYYDIAVLSYSGDGVVPLIGEGFIAVQTLAAQSPPTQQTTLECRLPDGGIALRQVTTPCWVKAEAHGQTPMYEALLEVRDLVRDWAADPAHAASFPPVIFHITDGETSDCDEQELCDLCRQIRQVQTMDGHTLLINIHIASGVNQNSIIFPSGGEIPETSRYAALLYDCSSVMPALFEPLIRELKGLGAIPPFRGMSYNASAAELLTILNIGSVSLQIQ